MKPETDRTYSGSELEELFPGYGRTLFYMVERKVPVVSKEFRKHRILIKVLPASTILNIAEIMAIPKGQGLSPWIDRIENIREKLS